MLDAEVVDKKLRHIDISLYAVGHKNADNSFLAERLNT